MTPPLTPVMPEPAAQRIAEALRERMAADIERIAAETADACRMPTEEEEADHG